MNVKEYLGFEQARNHRHAALYEDLLKRAFPGENITVLVGHHIGFEFNGDINTENEIPSADALLFDHAIMTKVFGEELAQTVMHLLCETEADQREEIVKTWLKVIDTADAKESESRSTHPTEVA